MTPKYGFGLPVFSCTNCSAWSTVSFWLMISLVRAWARWHAGRRRPGVRSVPDARDLQIAAVGHVRISLRVEVLVADQRLKIVSLLVALVGVLQVARRERVGLCPGVGVGQDEQQDHGKDGNQASAQPVAAWRQLGRQRRRAPPVQRPSEQPIEA